MQMVLGEFEKDALTEIFNIGVGLAADALYQLTGEHVPLSVPVVELTSFDKARQLYADRDQPVYAIAQTYQGVFSTDAVLVFAQESSLSLVRMMAGSDLGPRQMAEMAQDAMSELGNIILNAVMSALADALSLRLEGSLPTVTAVDAGCLFADPAPVGEVSAQDAPQVLALMIDFQLGAQHIPGYLAFLLDGASRGVLMARLNRYISDPAA